jgi:hypothetical protein
MKTAAWLIGRIAARYSWMTAVTVTRPIGRFHCVVPGPARTDAAASKANSKVLFHPARSRDVVQWSNQVARTAAVQHDALAAGPGAPGPSLL